MEFVRVTHQVRQGALNVYSCENSEPDELANLYQSVCTELTGGGTDIYTAVQYAIELIQGKYYASDYTTAVILMADGASVTLNNPDFETFYRESGTDIPVFSIMFGSAQREQLDEIAALSNARVFNGREDLVGAFRSVKGYN